MVSQFIFNYNVFNYVFIQIFLVGQIWADTNVNYTIITYI